MKNTLKFDTTTDLPNYGCEVFDVEKLPKFGKKFIKRKGINPLIVKKRKRGLTGSGKRLRCHPNVVALVRQYGGKQLQGYEVGGDIDRNGWIRTLWFNSHSVWVTPEGVATDVTNNSSTWFISSEEVRPFGDITIFIPTHENLWLGLSDTVPAFPTFEIKGSKKLRVHLVDDTYRLLPDPISKRLHESEDYEEIRKTIGLFPTEPLRYSIKSAVAASKLDESFSNPSLLTGKTWSEIQVR